MPWDQKKKKAYLYFRWHMVEVAILAGICCIVGTVVWVSVLGWGKVGYWEEGEGGEEGRVVWRYPG